MAESIDIGDFPPIIKGYWRDAFRDTYPQGARPTDTMYAITKARNEAAHPPESDIDLEFAVSSLADISEALATINESEQSLAVENIREALMPFTTHPLTSFGRVGATCTHSLWIWKP